MKRLLTAGVALFALASVATAQVTPGTPLGTTGVQPGVTGTVGGSVVTPGVTGAVGGTAGVQTPGFYPGGVASPSGMWGHPYGMTTGYNPYGGMNYGMTNGYNPYGNMNYGGYQPVYSGGVMQTGYGQTVGGYAPGYGSQGCGCGSAAYSQPVVYSQPVSDGGCGKKKRRGLFR